MKITRKQLRKLIIEAIEAGPHGVWRVPPEDRSPRISTGKLTKDRFHGTAPRKQHIAPEVQPLLDVGTPEYDEQAYELSDTIKGHTYGTAKGAVEDEKQSLLLSKLAASPLYEIIDEEPEGFKFSELLDDLRHEGTNYFGMQFVSDAGELMIDVTTDEHGHTQANAFVWDRGYGLWEFDDYEEVVDAFNKPGAVKEAIRKLAKRMQQRNPGK